jgi:hypothetical protein
MFAFRSYVEAGKGLLSYLHDYSDMPEVRASLQHQAIETYEPEVEFDRKTLWTEGFYAKPLGRLHLMEADMRCWRMYAIARQSINALLDAAAKRPALDRFLSVFGIDQMARKVSVARNIVKIDSKHWAILLEAKCKWPEAANGVHPVYGKEFAVDLFKAMLEVYLQVGKALELDPVIKR